MKPKRRLSVIILSTLLIFLTVNTEAFPDPDRDVNVRGHVREEVNASKIHEDGEIFNVFKLARKGDYARVEPREYEEMETFCYSGVRESLGLFWASASLRLELPSDDYSVYVGPNVR